MSVLWRPGFLGILLIMKFFYLAMKSRELTVIDMVVESLFYIHNSLSCKFLLKGDPNGNVDLTQRTMICGIFITGSIYRK